MNGLRAGCQWDDSVLQAASILYDAGALAVWLFGSRAGQEILDRQSDIDLAVQGLPRGTDAITRASHLTHRRLDVIRLETATPAFRYQVIRCRKLVPHLYPITDTSLSRPLLPHSLAGERTRTVAKLIREVPARSVIDFGCGYGWLLTELATDKQYERLTGVDLDFVALAGARRRINRFVGPIGNHYIDLYEGLITHRNPTYLGHDVGVAVEVIEHLETPQLVAFISVLFDFVRPIRVVLTTPNAEYNAIWTAQGQRKYRHLDHRFEWSRPEFFGWSVKIANSYGYSVNIVPGGIEHPIWGPPTQIAVFDKLDNIKTSINN